MNIKKSLLSKKNILFLALICVIFFLFQAPALAQEFDCLTYFTAVGCSHCANSDPIIFEQTLQKYPNLVVIEYEIAQQVENGPLNYQVSQNFGVNLGIPKIIFNKEDNLVGDKTIINNLENFLNQNHNKQCALTNGQEVFFNDLDLTSLHGKPKIWRQNRILIKTGTGGDDKLLKQLLSENLNELLKTRGDLKSIKPIKVALSGKSLEFEQAIEITGWIFQWRNGDSNESITETGQNNEITENNSVNNYQEGSGLTLFKIISLAAVDAVNPCAFAVLILMLITILTYNPKDKKKILLAGIAFILSIFLMYLFYGLVIIRLFKLIQALASVRIWLYKILGVLATVLGILNIRDFIKYRPGRIGTEMPMFLRPKVKKIISRATSPKGAFITGLFVTVFLLPCTIGPYVICGGILCAFDLLKALPWLLLYNLVFVIPMLIIVGIIYFGVSKVENISGWKDKNIKYLHLIAGTIILLLGLAMFLGWL